jgi:hypothetical protein
VQIERRVRPFKIVLEIEELLKKSMRENFMGCVDSIDKDMTIGGSYTSHAMFIKWYRMGLMGVFDFMIVNGRQAWNMSI